MSEPSKAVFLSYASQDADAAARICAALRAAGIEVWFDQSELRGGDAWDAMIRRQIKTCALFVAIISRNTHARDEGYFRLEWKLGVDRSNLMAAHRAFIVPLVIDDTPDDDEQVPDKFREVQWTRLPAGETPAAFVDRIRQLLSPAPASPLSTSPSPRIPGSVTPPTAAPHARSAGARPNARWIGMGAAFAVLAAAGYLVARHFSDTSPSPPPAGAAKPAEATPQPPAAVAPSSSGIPDKSIAVLPFTDMSERKDQEYFSQGLSEELIDQLARIPDLRVAARTSSFYFQGKSEDIATIAQKLRVAHILEGSVRKSGNTLRITAQLIRADNGYHLWSESYDREVKDVFKVQDDISHAVVAKLRVTLLARLTDTGARPPSSAAYNLYLQGRYVLARESQDDLARAVDFFKRSLALDDKFAPAWAGLARAYTRQVANGLLVGEQSFTLPAQAAEKAIAIDPSGGDAYSALALVQAASRHDWEGAKATLARGLAADPGNEQIIQVSANLTIATDTPTSAIPVFDRALDRDPLNLLDRRYRARALYYAGRLDDAQAAVRDVLSANPDFPAAHYELGRILLAKGSINEAVAAFEKEKARGWREFGLPLGYFAAHRMEETNKALAELLRNSAGSEMQVAETYGFFGRPDEAFKWLDDANTNKDPGLLWLRGDPLLKGIVHDPRYKAYLRKVGLPD